jgi:hypothetical protein
MGLCRYVDRWTIIERGSVNAGCLSGEMYFPYYTTYQYHGFKEKGNLMLQLIKYQYQNLKYNFSSSEYIEVDPVILIGFQEQEVLEITYDAYFA